MECFQCESLKNNAALHFGPSQDEVSPQKPPTKTKNLKLKILVKCKRQLPESTEKYTKADGLGRVIPTKVSFPCSPLFSLGPEPGKGYPIEL